MFYYQELSISPLNIESRIVTSFCLVWKRSLQESLLRFLHSAPIGRLQSTDSFSCLSFKLREILIELLVPIFWKVPSKTLGPRVEWFEIANSSLTVRVKRFVLKGVLLSAHFEKGRLIGLIWQLKIRT